MNETLIKASDFHEEDESTESLSHRAQHAESSRNPAQIILPTAFSVISCNFLLDFLFSFLEEKSRIPDNLSGAD